MDISKIDENFKALPTSMEGGKATYVIPNDGFSLHGVFYDSEEKCFLRMPLSVAATVSEGVAYLSHHTAGGRLCFATDSKTLEIVVQYKILEAMPHMAITGSAGFTLCKKTKDGERFLVNLMPHFGCGDGFTAAAELAGEGVQEYVLYFPLYNNVTGLSVRLDEGATVRKSKAYRDVLPILYYGSSITQGGCASRPDNAYQGLICKKNEIDYINLGFSGNAKAEESMVDYLSTIDCSLFVCDYDHNAPRVEHLENTHYALYERYRKARPSTPILFLTRPDYARVNVHESEKRMDIIRNTYKRARKAGDKKVFFLSGMEFYGKENFENFAVDGCHPTDYGFAKMAKRIYEKMCKIDKIFKGKKK